MRLNADMLLNQTKNLNLRAFKHSDIDAFLGWRNDPIVARFQGWPVPYSRSQAEHFFDALETTTPGDPGEWYQVAIEHRELGKLIGDCAFKTSDSGIQAEVGYTLARPYHGQGFASEAVRGLLDYLFNTLNMHRVSAYCDTRNEPSWKLLQRLNFRLEGHYIENYRDGGSWASEYHYAMLKREWTEEM